eukprot:g4659.t1
MTLRFNNFTGKKVRVVLDAGGGRFANVDIPESTEPFLLQDNECDSLTWWIEGRESDQVKVHIDSLARKYSNEIEIDLQTPQQKAAWRAQARELALPRTPCDVSNISGIRDPNFLDLVRYLEKSGEKFRDGSFNLDLAGIGVPKGLWARPETVFESPALFSQSMPQHGASAVDIQQGALGDCWIVATLAILVSHDVSIVRRMFAFSRPDLGLYVLRFFKEAKAVHVVVDDRLPFDGARLAFCRHANDRSLWGPMIEKAYAKLMGGYRNVIGGVIGYSLMDFTGHLSHRIDLTSSKKSSADVYDAVVKFHSDLLVQTKNGISLLLGCSIRPSSSERSGMAEEALSNGLFAGHAYAMKQVQIVTLSDGRRERLVELCNPWGRNGWKGDWSSKSECWNANPGVARTIRRSRDGGSFWMSMRDFVRIFDDVEGIFYSNRKLASAGNAGRLGDLSATHMSAVTASWTHATAGGSQGPRWHTNPQFGFKWTRAKKSDSILWISLIQSDAAWRRKCSIANAKGALARIAFQIWRQPKDSSRIVEQRETLFISDVSSRISYEASRNVSFNLSFLPMGDYILVPTTYASGIVGTFTIIALSSERILFVEKKSSRNDPIHSTRTFGGAMTFVDKKSAAAHTKESTASKMNFDDDIDDLFDSTGGDVDFLGDPPLPPGSPLKDGQNRKTMLIERNRDGRIGINFTTDGLVVTTFDNESAKRGGLLAGARFEFVDGIRVRTKQDVVDAVKGKSSIQLTVVQDPIFSLNVNRTRSGRLGIDFAKSTLVIHDVQNREASKLGLKPGQRIVSVNGITIGHSDDLFKMIGDAKNLRLGVVEDEDEVKRVEEENAKAKEEAARVKREAEARAASEREREMRERREREMRERQEAEMEEQRRSEVATLELEARANAEARIAAAAKRKAEVERAKRVAEAERREAEATEALDAEKRHHHAEMNRRREELRSKKSFDPTDIDSFMHPETKCNDGRMKRKTPERVVDFAKFRNFDSARSSPTVKEIDGEDDNEDEPRAPRLKLPPTRSQLEDVAAALKAPMPDQDGPLAPTHMEEALLRKMREKEEAARRQALREEVREEEAAARRRELAAKEAEIVAKRREDEIRRQEIASLEAEEWERRRRANMEAEEQREADLVLRREALAANLARRRVVLGESQSRRAAMNAAAVARTSCAIAMSEYDAALAAGQDALQVRRMIDSKVANALAKDADARVRRQEIEVRETEEREARRRKEEVERMRRLGHIQLDPKTETQTRLLMELRNLETTERDLRRVDEEIALREQQLRVAVSEEAFDLCESFGRHWGAYEGARDRISRLKVLNHKKSSFYANALCHQQVLLCDALRKGKEPIIRQVENQIEKMRLARVEHDENAAALRMSGKSTTGIAGTWDDASSRTMATT